MVSPSIKINITTAPSSYKSPPPLPHWESRKKLNLQTFTSLTDESYYYEMALLEIETGLKLNATGEISIKQTVPDYNYFLYYTGTCL